MTVEKEIYKNECSDVKKMPRMRTFASQEEADLFRLQRNLSLSDMERLQMLCRLIRIGKMLRPDDEMIEKKE
jgi:hypothetical protein